MLFSPQIGLATLLFPVIITAVPTTRADLRRHTPNPPAFWLAGDSTTAALNAGGGGWGLGFLRTVTNKAIGTDAGYDGDTTVSFVAQGAWGNIIDAVNRTKMYFDPYVTIQFGHNDQKASANISIAEYTSNLASMGQQVQAVGGTPILVTPISRRNFNSSGLVTEDLAPQRAATIAAANSIGADYIDLNEASTVYLDAIGAADAATYNRITGDFTHLNAVGSIVFGAMVSMLLMTTTSVGAKLEPYLKPNQGVEHAIQHSVYIYPSP